VAVACGVACACARAAACERVRCRRAFFAEGLPVSASAVRSSVGSPDACAAFSALVADADEKFAEQPSTGVTA
jgi:hypothetical protein